MKDLTDLIDCTLVTKEDRVLCFIVKDFRNTDYFVCVRVKRLTFTDSWLSCRYFFFFFSSVKVERIGVEGNCFRWSSFQSRSLSTSALDVGHSTINNRPQLWFSVSGHPVLRTRYKKVTSRITVPSLSHYLVYKGSIRSTIVRLFRFWCHEFTPHIYLCVCVFACCDKSEGRSIRLSSPTFISSCVRPSLTTKD